MNKAGVCIAIGVTLLSSVFAADWPQFCGLERNNVSSETGLARNWPENGPEMLWKTAVSCGYAGPAVKDGKVYFLDHDGENSIVRCLDLVSGKDEWQCAFSDPGELKDKKYEGTRGTPTVTDDSLYAVTLLGTVVCVDLDSRNVKWRRSLTKDFGKEPNGWGVAQSPLLYGGLILVAPLTDTNSLVALDKNSGEEVWTVSGFPGTGFVSPMLVSIDGEDQIVFVAGGTKPPRKGRKDSDAKEEPAKERPAAVVAVSPKDGSVRWNYTGWMCGNPIPHPILVGPDRVFITAGYKAVSTLIQLNKRDEGYAVEELLKINDAATQIGQPVFVNGHLFVGGTVKNAKNGLVCIDLDGTVKWNTNEIDGAPAFEHLNMIAADGMLIVLDGASGMLHLIGASPEAFKELASAKVFAEKGQTWAPIALSDGKLLVRDQTEMKCLNLK